MGAGGRVKGSGESRLNGDRVSVLQDEKGFGDGWWGWLHSNMNVLNAAQL